MLRVSLATALVLSACRAKIPDIPEPDPVEDCEADGDEDSDGAIGCEDSDCYGDACAEVCDRAGDEDGDGLQNCEDPDCFVDGGCVELDCTDAIDNDGDGDADCADPDCWGTGCIGREVVFTELNGRIPVRRIERYSYRSSCEGSLSVSQSSTQYVDIGSIAGELREHTAAGAVTTCGLRGTLYLEQSFDSGAEYGSADATFETSAGCNLTWRFEDVVNSSDFALGASGVVRSQESGQAMFIPERLSDFRDVRFTSTTSGRSESCGYFTRRVRRSGDFPMLIAPNARLGDGNLPE